MIREFERFHGLALARLLHGADNEIRIHRFDRESNSGYVVDGRLGLYVKYCSKRLSPWRFTFNPEHRSEIKRLQHAVGRMFLALVCNDDGVVCLNQIEMQEVIGDDQEIAWIRAERHLREMYTVSGSTGDLSRKVGVADFPAKLFSI